MVKKRLTKRQGVCYSAATKNVRPQVAELAYPLVMVTNGQTSQEIAMPFKLQKSITTTPGLTAGEHSMSAGTAQGGLPWRGQYETASSVSLSGGQHVHVEVGSGVLMLIVLICDLIFITVTYNLVCALLS